METSSGFTFSNNNIRRYMYMSIIYATIVVPERKLFVQNCNFFCLRKTVVLAAISYSMLSASTNSLLQLT